MRIVSCSDPVFSVDRKQRERRAPYVDKTGAYHEVEVQIAKLRHCVVLTSARSAYASEQGVAPHSRRGRGQASSPSARIDRGADDLSK